MNLTDKRISTDYKSILKLAGGIQSQEKNEIRNTFELFSKYYNYTENQLDENYVIAIETVRIFCEEYGIDKFNIVPALSIYSLVNNPDLIKEVKLFASKQTIEILSELQRIEQIDASKLTNNPENFLKLLLNTLGDLRILFVKLSMTTAILRIKPDQKTAKVAYYLYAPVLHQLGLYNQNREILDLAFAVLFPSESELIRKQIEESEFKRQEYIKEFLTPVEKALKEQNLEFSIKSRLKSLHSVWKKMQKQGVGFHQVFDLWAIRIILRSEKNNEKADCWHAYSVITNIYKPNPGRLRDWITVPKDSGYESLHTTVAGPDNQWVEVQIRTERMDEIAEKGLAAHWKYKGNKTEKSFESWINNLRQVLENPDKTMANMVFSAGTVRSEDVFVFTPNGELRKMKQGATVLDFAFEVHTEVGSRCVGGRVNKRIVPIRQVLENGDMIEIITSKNQKPAKDWLNMVVTNKAKTKIRKWLIEEENRFAESGKDLLKRKCRNWKIALGDAEITKLLQFFKCKTSIEFYSGLALNKYDFSKIKSIITDNPDSKIINEIIDIKKTSTENKKKQVQDILRIDPKLNQISYYLAKCCNPIPGDRIFGFVTVDKGITIHKLDCPNVLYLETKFPYRKIEAEWIDSTHTPEFEVNIYISGNDEMGLVNKITETISKSLNVNILSINIESKQKRFEGYFKLQVKNVIHLESIITKLKQIKNIDTVLRTDQ